MSLHLEQYYNNYACLYADCIPVKGAKRSALYDLTRNEIVLFPTAYYSMLEYLFSDRIQQLLDGLESEEEKQCFLDFIDFLNEQEVLLFTENPSLFPKVKGGMGYAGSNK